MRKVITALVFFVTASLGIAAAAAQPGPSQPDELQDGRGRCQCLSHRSDPDRSECHDGWTYSECRDWCTNMGYYRNRWETGASCFD